MSKALFQTILDNVEEGLVLINNQGLIEHINVRAKEIMGIIQKNTRPHPGGTINKGDIVIIGNNRLGYDDGDLVAEDLKCIGIEAEELLQGDSFIAIGVYGDPSIKGVYKSWRNKTTNDRLMLQSNFSKHLIEVTIDVILKFIEIKIDNEVFRMRFSLAIGHMVVIDGEKEAVKFYQSRGYTVRRESIAEILKGASYIAKGDPSIEFDVLQKPIGNVFESTTLLSRVELCISNGEDFFENEYYEINKRPMMCSLRPTSDGMLLKILDISNIEILIEERNNLILQMERTQHSFHNSAQNEGIIGISQPMQRVRHLIQRAAMTKSTVLLTGESGTGKTYIASEIHRLTFPKGDRPFISVNCTAIPASLFESELFGYLKGAFTGAEKGGKAGLFELAENGTLFLDEIGEIPIETQVKLLHVLQNKTFYKVGSTKPTQVNVRVIVATNKDLLQEISNKRFREDLYYRINGFPIEIPPLRNRKSDLYSLIQHFLGRLKDEFDGNLKHLSGEALELMMAYDWPGNIRELENTIELAYNMADGMLIRSEDLNLPISKILAPTGLRDYLSSVERKYILETLSQYNYDTKATIEKLGISKSVFYEKIKKFNISLN